MSIYDATFELVIRVNDPTEGIDLYENMDNIVDYLTEKVKEKHPHCVVVPRGFKRVE